MRNYKSEYAKKLLDPRWQKKRLEILNRDNWTCQICWSEEKTLHVHHLYYGTGLEPWEADSRHLVTVCQECHEEEGVKRPKAIDDLKHVLAIARMHAGDIQSLISLIAAIAIETGSRTVSSYDLDAVRFAIGEPFFIENAWGKLEAITRSNKSAQR